MLDLFKFKLSHGNHKRAEDGVCFMEAVAWMSRLPHSDRPECACPVLGAFGIRLNDRMSDTERTTLNPLIIKMMNTRSKPHEELRAAYLLRGVAAEILPLVFEDRGWHDLAKMVRAIPVGATRADMVPVLRKVRDLAAKYRNAAYAYAAAAADAAAYAYAAADADAAAAAAYAAAAADAAAYAYAADAAAYAAAAADAAQRVKYRDALLQCFRECAAIR